MVFFVLLIYFVKINAKNKCKNNNLKNNEKSKKHIIEKVITKEYSTAFVILIKNCYGKLFRTHACTYILVYS